MQADFTDSFNNLTKESSVPSSDICVTSSQSTDAYVKASMIQTAVALASGSRWVYTTSLTIDQFVIDDNVLRDLAEKVRLAGIDHSVPIPNVVSRFVTCTALSKMTSGSLDYWASMYGTYIESALNAVTFVTSYQDWQNACLQAIKALPQMEAWGYQLKTVLTNVDVGNIMSEIIYALTQTLILDRYLFKRINSKDAHRRFYQTRCDNLARNLHVIHLFSWVYGKAGAGTKPQVANKFKDVLTTAGVQISADASSRATVTSDVTEISDRNATSLAALQDASASFKRNQTQLEQMHTHEIVAGAHKRNARRALLVWAAVAIVALCAIGAEAYRGNASSLSVLSLLVLAALAIYWIVATARSLPS
jgi:hypothetical protein